MPSLNLFVTCAENNPVLEREFNNLISTLSASDRDVLLRFSDRIARDGQVAINMRPMTLLDFLASERCLNIYEWVDLILRKSSKGRDEILRDKLGAYYERRITFDGYFIGGQEFRYGTLNIGGLGTNRYGEYCVVIDVIKLSGEGELGYLGGDSLRSYMTMTPEVDEPELRNHCATDSHKQFLAALKHAAEVARIADDQWPNLICNHGEYIEAIFTGNLHPDQILTVRIARTDYELYWEYAFNEHRERLSEVDRYRVDTFARIDEYLDNLGVSWEQVVR